MFPWLPSQVLEDVFMFLPMSPDGIREIRSVCLSTAREFTDAKLRNFSLDIDPVVLMSKAPASGGLLGFSNEITAWFARVQRARAVRHLDVTLACRSDTAISIMSALHDLLGVTLSVTESHHPQPPIPPSSSPISATVAEESTKVVSPPSSSVPVCPPQYPAAQRLAHEKAQQQQRTAAAASACEQHHRQRHPNTASELLVRPKPKSNKAAEKAANDRKVAAERRAAGVMDVLQRLRLADTGRDTFSGHALHHILAWPPACFPVLEHLTVILRTWHARGTSAIHDARGPMSDLARRFPSLTHLTLCGTRWDSWVWEPTVRHIAKAPASLRTLRLCFHAEAEEAVVSALATALTGGALGGLEDLRLRSTMDMYDSFDAGMTGSDPNVNDGSGGRVGYGDHSALSSLGKALGAKLAPSLRRLEVRLQCDNSQHSTGLWKEMGNASDPLGGMLWLTRFAVHMCPAGLSGLTDLIESGSLPVLNFLEVAVPPGKRTTSAAAEAGDFIQQKKLPGRLLDPIDKHQLATQFERLRLEGDGPLGQQKAPAPSCVFGGAGRLVSSLFISRPSAGGRLRTLSLDVGLAGCKGDEMQGAVAALLESGACPELRRLWLFPGDLLGDEEVVDDGTGAGGKSGFCVGGVAVVSEAGDRDTGEYNVGAAADSTGNRGESPPDKKILDGRRWDGKTDPRPTAPHSGDGGMPLPEAITQTTITRTATAAATTTSPTTAEESARCKEQNMILSAQLLSALTSPRCPPAVAEAFADRGCRSLEIPAHDRWWGV